MKAQAEIQKAKPLDRRIAALLEKEYFHLVFKPSLIAIIYYSSKGKYWLISKIKELVIKGNKIATSIALQAAE